MNQPEDLIEPLWDEDLLEDLLVDNLLGRPLLLGPGGSDFGESVELGFASLTTHHPVEQLLKSKIKSSR